MEIEDIINRVRFTSSEDKSAWSRALRESTDTSITSESRSTSESISSCLGPFSTDEHAAYDCDVSHWDLCKQQKQAHIGEEVQRQAYSPPKRRRARTTSETYDQRQLSRSWPLQQSQQHMPGLYGYAMQPMYYPAYMVVPMPPATYVVPHPGMFGVSQGQHYRPKPPQHNYEEEKHPVKPHSSGVRLPPLPESLRRAQKTSKKKPAEPREKRKRIRVPPVIHEYDHLNVEEAIQELARRNIYITDMQQLDVSRTNLVRLLQRADRNNNKGSGTAGESEWTTTLA